MKPDEGLVKFTGGSQIHFLLIPEEKNKTISADVRMIDFGAAAIFRSQPVSSFSITRTCTAEVMCWISTTAISFWGNRTKIFLNSDDRGGC